jgi:hypothetical protein
MPNFIDRLDERLSEAQKKQELRQTLTQSASPHERSLQELVAKHWHTPLRTNPQARCPAFAIDGSRAVRHLANGAYLFVAQALAIGDEQGNRVESSDVDVRILPGATDEAIVERSAGFMMHRLEVTLAREQAQRAPQGSVLFLDGALYGQLSSLYPLSEKPETELPPEISDMPQEILAIYLDLFAECAKRNLFLISIAKTSHEVAHGEVWWREMYGKEESMPRVISDSEAIYRWTGRGSGFSTPILFGTRAFFRGSRRALLDSMKSAPAIVSFFVRLDDFDDALRIDVPAACIGRRETIGEVEQEQLIEPAEVQPILDWLALDYGGLEVYNALLYSVDREVRLRQEVMDQVYLSVIQNALGGDVEIRLDRSERRFHSR